MTLNGASNMGAVEIYSEAVEQSRHSAGLNKTNDRCQIDPGETLKIDVLIVDFKIGRFSRAASEPPACEEELQQ